MADGRLHFKKSPTLLNLSVGLILWPRLKNSFGIERGIIMRSRSKVSRPSDGKISNKQGSLFHAEVEKEKAATAVNAGRASEWAQLNATILAQS